jgi:hypothetical protein
MEANGYEWNMADDRCPITSLVGPDTSEINPYCYQPRDWFGKAVYRIDIR